MVSLLRGFSDASADEAAESASQNRALAFGLLRSALRQQSVVVGALALREVRTRFGENRLGYLWALLEPCLFIAIWLLVFSVFRVGSSIHDMGPVLFMATGIIPFFAFRNVAKFVEQAVASNTALLQFPLVKPVDALLARFMLESATQGTIAFILFAALIAMGQAEPPRDYLGLLAAGGGLLLLGFGFGAFSCMFGILFPLYSKLSPLIARLLFWTSGIFFLADKFPPQIRNVLAWNPVLHGLELFRSAWSFTFQTSIGSYGYLYSCAGVLLLLALLLDQPARRELQDQ